MNSFSVSQCLYDGTTGGPSGDPNPLCIIYGSVNGNNVLPRVFYSAIVGASAANMMQAYLTSVLFAWWAQVFGYEQEPFPSPSQYPLPSFPAYNIPAPRVQGDQDVSIPQTLIGSWTA
jgi:hypothetical protein